MGPEPSNAGHALAPSEPFSHDAVEPGETPHAFLRRATRPWHDGVEQTFERFDLRTFEGLSGFLLRQASALLPLETALEDAGIAEQLADWPARRRMGLLTADLARLGLDPPDPTGVPDLPTALHRLGALYVLEGSKLGARVLHRRVLASTDPRVRAAGGFLGHRHEHGWSGFLAVLDGVPLEVGAANCLREGAFAAFACFRQAGQRETVPLFMGAPTRSGLYLQAHA